MRLTIRVLVVTTGTVLFIAGGFSPEHATDTRSETARAATVVRIERVQQPPATGRARQAAEARAPGATAREAEREAGDDDRRDGDDRDDDRRDDDRDD